MFARPPTGISSSATKAQPIHDEKERSADLAPARDALEAPRILYVRPSKRWGSRVHHGSGGGERDRTDDLLLAKQALSQLSYTPSSLRGVGWWAWEDLNFRPHAYQARALTN